jgi:hypothetical protein
MARAAQCAPGTVCEASTSQRPLERAFHALPGAVRFGSPGVAGASRSSFTHTDFAEAWTVPTITPAALLDMAADATSIFIKVDIEGGEYSVFPELVDAFRAKRPTILLSLHPRLIPGGYLAKRRLSRRIFRACADRKAERLRQAPHALSALRGALARAGLTVGHPRGTWLFTR